MRPPESFSYWWFFTEIRKEQSNYKSLKLVRNFLRKHITIFTIMSVFAMFNNFTLYLFLSIYAIVGTIELFFLLKALIMQNVTYFRRKIKRNSIW